jgi:hypothetical protein
LLVVRLACQHRAPGLRRHASIDPHLVEFDDRVSLPWLRGPRKVQSLQIGPDGQSRATESQRNIRERKQPWNKTNAKLYTDNRKLTGGHKY